RSHANFPQQKRNSRASLYARPPRPPLLLVEPQSGLIFSASFEDKIMRLTLRTMLAYLDDLLEPADRDEIARKIEENEFARKLVERIRECTRNSKLSAAKALGKGIDANTVAEYLDNTLASERVPDFEKLCLDQNADLYLAEAASCHQILTMVLG